MSDVGLTGQLSSRRSWWAWQWFTWPIYAHQFTTESIWRPGNAPFRTRAWQPDVSGWTTGRFAFDMGHWSGVRNVRPSDVLISMNTGTAWLPTNAAPIPPPPGTQQLVITSQYFPISGTYTPPAGLLYAEVECAGGGGGGGSCPANTVVAAGAGGGGSGALTRAIVPGSAISGTVNVLVGGGGLPDAAGGQTSFGAFATAPGGSPGSTNDGTFSSESVAGAGGPGGARGVIGGGATGLTLPGNAGGTGFSASIIQNSQTHNIALGGIGGAIIGGVAQPFVAGGAFPGLSAQANTGAGGGGAIGNQAQPAASGGNGGSGYVFVTEFSLVTTAAAAVSAPVTRQLQPFGA